MEDWRECNNFGVPIGFLKLSTMVAKVSVVARETFGPQRVGNQRLKRLSTLSKRRKYYGQSRCFTDGLTWRKTPLSL